MKHWKAPDEKIWFVFVVDGKRLRAIEGSTKLQKEIKRVNKLKGVAVEVANDNDLVRAGAKTELPKRIIDKVRSMYKSNINCWR